MREPSSFTIKNSTFVGNSGIYADIAAYNVYGFMQVLSCTFTESNGISVSAKDSILLIFNSSFSNISSNKVLLLVKPFFSNITDNSFSNLSVDTALFIDDTQGSGFILNNAFTNIVSTSHSGAALTLQETENYYITQNAFRNISFSSEFTTHAAAILISEDSTEITISHNSFESCRADIGGAL